MEPICRGVRGGAGTSTGRENPARRDEDRSMARLIVNVDVDDLEAAVRFYTNALGLRVGRRFDGSWIELVGAEAPIYLLVASPGTAPFEGAEVRRDYRRHWTPVHLDFAVDDLEAAVRQAEAAGAKLERPIRDRRWGKIALLSDPFGNGFCLLKFEGRGYDEVATGAG
jgi:predicted enzyme related to lactoylglutathione lyase